MCFSMTGGTQRDQVVLGILSQLTAELLVMNLKIAPAAARLTFPSIPLQNFATELLVRFGSKSLTGMFGSDRIHEAR